MPYDYIFHTNRTISDYSTKSLIKELENRGYEVIKKEDKEND